jgi:hypothetical protein
MSPNTSSGPLTRTLAVWIGDDNVRFPVDAIERHGAAPTVLPLVRLEGWGNFDRHSANILAPGRPASVIASHRVRPS